MIPAEENSSLDLKIDQELVIFAQQGDLEAFNVLIHRYEKHLENVVYDIVLDHKVTKNILSESVKKAFLNVGRIGGNEKFFSWIHQIVHTESINFVLKHRTKIIPKAPLPISRSN